MHSNFLIDKQIRNRFVIILPAPRISQSCHWIYASRNAKSYDSSRKQRTSQQTIAIVSNRESYVLCCAAFFWFTLSVSLCPSLFSKSIFEDSSLYFIWFVTHRYILSSLCVNVGTIGKKKTRRKNETEEEAFGVYCKLIFEKNVQYFAIFSLGQFSVVKIYRPTFIAKFYHVPHFGYNIFFFT